MVSFGRALLGLSAFCSLWCASSTSSAQARRDKQQPFILTRETPDVGAGDRGRARARAGDCKGALDAFDMAIRTSQEPTLRRDRGLCHEQLQHPFPAIDDYRMYLRDRPNAPDADQIRERLVRLEEQAGVGGRGDKPANADDPSSGSGASASASVSINGDGVSGNATSSGASSGKKSESQEDFERDEKLAAAASGSPLRESSGWSIGPYFSVRDSVDATTSVTVAGTKVTGKAQLGVNETVGGAVRYSFGKVSSLITEFGYVSFNDNNVAGPGFFLGYEARIAISRYTSDAILAGVGLGYERYRESNNGGTLNNLMPRARLGYRHVFGSSIGLEFHGDGGLAYYWLNSNQADVTFSLTPVFGGYVALLVGF